MGLNRELYTRTYADDNWSIVLLTRVINTSGNISFAPTI